MNLSELHFAENSHIADMKSLRNDFTRFMMLYKFAIDEVTTKISILQEEFSLVHDYNPIEHLSSRLKSPESIMAKVARLQCEPSFDNIRNTLHDIAGVRITCSFVSDTYKVFDMLTNQKDIRILEVKDYIKNPKENGYKSLHAILEVPVFMSTGVEPVKVEVQIRTIAMDFWASLEHKIYYKYNKDVPVALLDELKVAATTASQLDATMERLHDEVKQLDVDTTMSAEAEESTQHPKLSDRLLNDLNEARKNFFRRASKEAGPPNPE
nr:GTP pyrophosphokinase family protein [Lysinibacter cavernae]